MPSNEPAYTGHWRDVGQGHQLSSPNGVRSRDNAAVCRLGAQVAGSLFERGANMKSRALGAAVLTICLHMSIAPAGAQSRSPQEANWPSFRGADARGIAEGYATPTTWDAEQSKNIRW